MGEVRDVAEELAVVVERRDEGDVVEVAAAGYGSFVITMSPGPSRSGP